MNRKMTGTGSAALAFWWVLASVCAAEDRIIPGDFVAERPTPGVPLDVSGDGNRNASVKVAYRAEGASSWKTALLLLRINGEVRTGFDGGGALKLIDCQKAHHHHFEGLTFRNADHLIYAGREIGCTGLVVRRCRMADAGYPIFGLHPERRDFYIADNTMVGPHREWHPRTGKENDSHAVWLSGQGHVVCHDRNRIFNVFMAISMQPIYGGPAYIFRNSIFNCTRSPLKPNQYPAGLMIFNNTLLAHSSAGRFAAMWQNTRIHNNLFMGTDGGPGVLWTGTQNG